MCYSYMRLRFTSKAGVGFLVSPTREEQTMVAMSVLGSSNMSCQHHVWVHVGRALIRVDGYQNNG